MLLLVQLRDFQKKLQQTIAASSDVVETEADAERCVMQNTIDTDAKFRKLNKAEYEGLEENIIPAMYHVAPQMFEMSEAFTEEVHCCTAVLSYAQTQHAA